MRNIPCKVITSYKELIPFTEGERLAILSALDHSEISLRLSRHLGYKNSLMLCELEAKYLIKCLEKVSSDAPVHLSASQAIRRIKYHLNLI